MKRTPKKTADGRRQLCAVIAIVLVGMLLGTYVLVKKSAATEDHGHGHGTHAEAKSHSDGEHHDKKASDKHDHDKGHGDEEHHDKTPSKGSHGAALHRRQVLAGSAPRRNKPAVRSCRSG